MSLDTQHAEKLARAQCEELERQAKQLLSIGYKLNELEIVSFQSDGRKEVWPKVLVQYHMILGKHNLPKPPLLIEQLKWSKQVPWVSGWWWCRSPVVSNPIATVKEVRANYGPNDESDLISLQYRSTNGDWYEADSNWEWAGPIPEPIN